MVLDFSWSVVMNITLVNFIVSTCRHDSTSVVSAEIHHISSTARSTLFLTLEILFNGNTMSRLFYDFFKFLSVIYELFN